MRIIIILICKTKKEIIEFLDNVKNIDNNNFRLIERNVEKDKHPYKLLNILEYDFTDLIIFIKSLTYQDYLRCQIDSKNSFLFMYCFIKTIQDIIVYIKLSIVNNNDTIVYIISFHKAQYDELILRPFKED